MLNTRAHKKCECKNDKEHRAVFFVKANTFTIFLFLVNISCGNPIIEKDTDLKTSVFFIHIKTKSAYTYISLGFVLQ